MALDPTLPPLAEASALGRLAGKFYCYIPAVSADNLLASPAMGKAEALWQSMLAMIDSDDQTLQHPFSWAAFSLVG